MATVRADAWCERWRRCDVQVCYATTTPTRRRKRDGGNDKCRRRLRHGALAWPLGRLARLCMLPSAQLSPCRVTSPRIRDLLRSRLDVAVERASSCMLGVARHPWTYVEASGCSEDAKRTRRLAQW
nr:unnamed protein product [Digitaria exilis]